MTEPGAAPRGSMFEDYVDIFISPAELFRRRADGRFGQALFVLLVSFAVLYFATRSAMQPIMDAEFARGMASAMKRNPNLTAEQFQQGKKFFETFGGIIFIVAMPISALLLGVAVWLASRVIGRGVSYAQGATIATFSLFPRIVDMIAGAVQGLLLDESRLTSRYSVSLGAGRFLDPQQTNPVLLSLLGRVDLFTLWVTVLIAVGLRQIAKATVGQAAAAAVIVWLLGALPTLLQAMRS